MKPIKLDKLPDDPCKECIIQAGCTKTCQPKMDYAEYICSKFYGEHLNIRYKSTRKNADKLKKLFEENKRFNPCNPLFVR